MGLMVVFGGIIIYLVFCSIYSIFETPQTPSPLFDCYSLRKSGLKFWKFGMYFLSLSAKTMKQEERWRIRDLLSSWSC